MRQLTVLRGLPGSGKSTYAQKLVDDSSYHTKRVSKDHVRGMIDFGHYSEVDEYIVKDVETMLAIDLLDAGFDVVVDDTNLRYRDVEHWRNVAESYGPGAIDFIVHEIKTDVDVCIARDAEREKPVGEERIRQMAERFESWQID